MRFFLLAMAALVLPISAQVPGGFTELPQSLVQYFGFTPDQASQIQTFNRSLSDFIDDRYQRWDELDEEVADELDKASPDPTLVGTKIVEMVMIDRDVEKEATATVGKVQALLTAEQKQKLKALEDAMGLSGTITQAWRWSILSPPQAALDGGLTSQLNEKSERLSRLLSRKK